MKALAALEVSPEGIPDIHFSLEKISYPNSQRIWHIFQALRHGLKIEQINDLTKIHPWFLEQLHAIVEFEKEIKKSDLDLPMLSMAKRKGFTDARIAKLKNKTEIEVTKRRQALNLHPSFLQVDTCAGEFLSSTPYYYSTYWSFAEVSSPVKPIVAVIGSGPNRIGQGIEGQAAGAAIEVPDAVDARPPLLVPLAVDLEPVHFDRHAFDYRLIGVRQAA